MVICGLAVLTRKYYYPCVSLSNSEHFSYIGFLPCSGCRLTGKEGAPVVTKKAPNKQRGRGHASLIMHAAGDSFSSSPVLLSGKRRLPGAKQTNSNHPASNGLSLDQIQSATYLLTPTQGSLACCKPHASLDVLCPQRWMDPRL